MRSLLLAAVSAVALFSTGAVAADLRVAPRPVTAIAPAPVPNWTGAFVGIHAGYAWANREGGYDVSFFGNLFDSRTYDYGVEGYLLGGQVGYLHQFGGSPLVFGFEVDGSWSNAKGIAVNDLGDETADVKIRWMATAAAKLGFAVTNNLLVFAKGGVAFGDFDHVGYTGCDFTNTNVGWMAGGGGEFKFANNVSFKAEYNYVDFGTKTTECTAGLASVETTGKITAHIAKAGLNFYFK